ncbi:MAG: phytoene desaturase [Alphaproteobacteria bacterium]|nr:phytoene desaturase [Alphaproteobacteria bacterium]
MRTRRVAIIGAGVGGLAAAAQLAHAGCEVAVLEAAAAPGGKMRVAESPLGPIDCGPTVLTMRWAFDALFDSVGARLDDAVALEPLSVLARHAWPDGAALDLFADLDASTDAIGALAGPEEAQAFRAFCAEGQRIFDTLKAPFLTASKPNPLTLARRIGLAHLDALFAIRPFDTLWSALSNRFRDPRLRQLFGRYATYCGSSPFAAPATLMLVTYAELQGVWGVRGGMHALAHALADLAEARGARVRYGCAVSQILVEGGAATGIVCASGERILCDAVVCNADAQALADGAFGTHVRRATAPAPRNARSLSAVTLAFAAQARGFPLLRHNVFFSSDYKAEFDALFTRRAAPHAPTLYVCAQDQTDAHSAHDAERIFVLANAPARGDDPTFPSETNACEMMTDRLTQFGLSLTPLAPPAQTTPADFHRLYPATGGALYGRASHGWLSTFLRPSATTPIRGLFLAGGSVHPGPGVPMAALSGMQAASSALRHLTSARPSRRAAIAGGTSTRSATTGSAA